jgi:outer membrane receptor protein involved in Fe transport
MKKGACLAAGAFLLFLFLLHSTLGAQDSMQQVFRGHVYEKTGVSTTPVYLATVSFFLQADTLRPFLTTFTDSTGLFQVKLDAGRSYVYTISMVGYKKASGEVDVRGTTGGMAMAPIYLEPDQSILKAVAVTGRRPFIEQRVDRLVMNIGNSILADNNTAFDILQRAPGVYIDQSGNISLKGKAGATVMIDGRPLYLAAGEVINMLRNMQGNNIERIEIMVNPSAKYDAAGTGGIINIVTKKTKKQGLAGSVNAGAGVGVYPKFNAGGNLNYRNRKLNIYTIGSFSQNKQPHDFDNYRYVTEPGGTRNFIQQTNHIRRNNSRSIRGGLDYFINSKTTLGFMASHNSGRNAGDYYGTTTVSKGSTLLETLQRTSTARATSAITTGNLNFRRQLKTEGEQITVDADLSQYQGDADILYKVQSRKQVNGSREYIFRNLTPIKVRIHTLQADYTRPFGKGMQLDGGVKQSFVRTDNTFRFDSLVHDSWNNDTLRTNTFRYKEAVTAAYLNFVKQIDSTLSIQAGLRAEATHTNAYSVTLDSLNKRSYLSLFPSLFISKQLSANHHLSFSYSRRINRPNYADLNPFIFFVDQYDVSQGNPYLRPAFIHSMELSWLLRNRYQVSGGYSNTRDQFMKIVLQDTVTKIATELNENLDRYHNYYVSAALPFDIRTWWESFYYFNISYKDYMSRFADNNGWTIQFYTENTFQLPWNLTTLVSYNFFYAQAYGLYRSKPVSYIDLSLRKSFKENRCAITFRAADIFRMNKTTTYIRYNDIDQTTLNYYEGRIFRLSFTYRIGNRANTQRERKTSSKDEQGRISAN